VQFYMQTGGGFVYQSQNTSLPVDGAFHDLVFPLAGVSDRNFVDTHGFDLFGHTGDLVIRVDSVIYSSRAVPEPTTIGLIGSVLIGGAGVLRRQRRAD